MLAAKRLEFDQNFGTAATREVQVRAAFQQLWTPVGNPPAKLRSTDGLCNRAHRGALLGKWESQGVWPGTTGNQSGEFVATVNVEQLCHDKVAESLIKLGETSPNTDGLWQFACCQRRARYCANFCFRLGSVDVKCPEKEMIAEMEQLDLALASARNQRANCQDFQRTVLDMFLSFADAEEKRNVARDDMEDALANYEDVQSTVQECDDILRNAIQIETEMRDQVTTAERERSAAETIVNDLVKRMNALANETNGTVTGLALTEQKLGQATAAFRAADNVRISLYKELRAVSLLTYNAIHSPMQSLLTSVQGISLLDVEENAADVRSRATSLRTLCQSSMETFQKEPTDAFSNIPDVAKNEWAGRVGLHSSESPPVKAPHGAVDFCAGNVSDEGLVNEHLDELIHLITFRQRGEDGSIGKLLSAVTEFIQRSAKGYKALGDDGGALGERVMTVTETNFQKLLSYSGHYVGASFYQRYLHFWQRQKYLSLLFAHMRERKQELEEAARQGQDNWDSLQASLEETRRALEEARKQLQDTAEQERKALEQRNEATAATVDAQSNVDASIAEQVAMSESLRAAIAQLELMHIAVKDTIGKVTSAAELYTNAIASVERAMQSIADEAEFTDIIRNDVLDKEAIA
eukprot:TRINITY_DN4262_c0_g1_i1.p1 TRINITY_DN4262_c0_g1~~TRINITY_DN4262_c0_g1_i1.p1  ORF type:complete len:729 (-),score=116.89 TRINITY_DN4262_c0_g1_i1:231-2144(-)